MSPATEMGYTFPLGHITYFVPKRDGIGKKGTCKLALHRLGYKTNSANVNKLLETMAECLCDFSNRNGFLLTGGDTNGRQFCEWIPDDRESFVRITV